MLVNPGGARPRSQLQCSIGTNSSRRLGESRRDASTARSLRYDHERVRNVGTLSSVGIGGARPILADALAKELDRANSRGNALTRRIGALGTRIQEFATKMRQALGRVSRNTWLGTALLTAGTAVAIVEDFASDVWADRPMLAALAGGVLVLGWTVVLVNQYLAARERRRWLTVAASALEDLGRVARAAWMQLVINLRLMIVVEPQVAVLRAEMMSAEGRLQLRAAARRIAGGVEGRAQIFDQLHQIAETSRAVLALWTPIMITQPDEATHLGDFADFHRRVVQLLGFLSREVKSSWPLAISQQEVADKLVKIIEMAAQQDHDLFEAAEGMVPL